jgi:hypothetical protein
VLRGAPFLVPAGTVAVAATEAQAWPVVALEETPAVGFEFLAYLFDPLAEFRNLLSEFRWPLAGRVGDRLLALLYLLT